MTMTHYSRNLGSGSARTTSLCEMRMIVRMRVARICAMPLIAALSCKRLRSQSTPLRLAWLAWAWRRMRRLGIEWCEHPVAWKGLVQKFVSASLDLDKLQDPASGETGAVEEAGSPRR